jgi:hypothetical protein
MADSVRQRLLDHPVRRKVDARPDGTGDALDLHFER